MKFKKSERRDEDRLTALTEANKDSSNNTNSTPNKKKTITTGTPKSKEGSSQVKTVKSSI